MRVLKTLSLTALFVALGAAPALAQQATGADESRTTLSANALDAAVSGHELAVDQQRAQLAELLSREEVREIAHDRGIDMGQVQSAAAGLSDGEVATVTPLVAKASAALQRGGTITISAITVIIIILILILIT